MHIKTKAIQHLLDLGIMTAPTQNYLLDISNEVDEPEPMLQNVDSMVVELYGEGSTDVEFLRHNNNHVALKVGDILFDNWRLNERGDFLLFFNHQVNARLNVPLYEEEGVVAASLETRATDNAICSHTVSRLLLDRILDADDWQPGRIVPLKGDQADEK